MGDVINVYVRLLLHKRGSYVSKHAVLIILLYLYREGVRTIRN